MVAGGSAGRRVVRTERREERRRGCQWQPLSLCVRDTLLAMGDVCYLVLITVRPGQLNALRAYERAVGPVMARHGGRLERVLQPVSGDAAEFDEVHLLAFDDEHGFAAFRADPDRAAYDQLREAAVERAIVLQVQDVPVAEYLGPP